MKCPHNWYKFEFGLGSIAYILEGDPQEYNYKKQFRICDKCFKKEQQFVFLDDFRQAKGYWGSLTDISNDYLELNKKIKSVCRELKIGSIDDNK